jgi:GNAT superfamily N-acetyltransferase
MGRVAVDTAEVAAVVTRLAMTTRPRPALLPQSPFRLLRWASPEPANYRQLFRRVGDPWLWYSRLLLDDVALTAIIADPAVEVYAVVDPTGIEVGLVELDFRSRGVCEIVYFGLVAELTGQKLGRWMMAQALLRAWRNDIDRVWLNTCSLDHPSALGFYRASGFRAEARWVEVFPDPRLSGVLPPGAAPHIPLLGASPDAS